MKNLFAYGTLMYEEIMNEVSGCSPEPFPATLYGYDRKAVKGEHYPAVLPDRAGRVEGLLYRKIPASAWERLDRFEGEMYLRVTVEVHLEDGTKQPADVYVAKPEFYARLDVSGWDPDDFLRRGKDVFRRGYQGYQSI